MLLTQAVAHIVREQLMRFHGLRHDNINLFISLYIVDHYLNIGLLEL